MKTILTVIFTTVASASAFAQTAFTYNQDFGWKRDLRRQQQEEAQASKNASKKAELASKKVEAPSNVVTTQTVKDSTILVADAKAFSDLMSDICAEENSVSIVTLVLKGEVNRAEKTMKTYLHDTSLSSEDDFVTTDEITTVSRAEGYAKMIEEMKSLSGRIETIEVVRLDDFESKLYRIENASGQSLGTSKTSTAKISTSVAAQTSGGVQPPPQQQGSVQKIRDTYIPGRRHGQRIDD